jgi:hypothetical protein
MKKPKRNPLPSYETKQMSTEAYELALFIENDGDLYRQQTLPIITNLQKKFTKGTYNHAASIKLWKRLADNGAKKYIFEHVDRHGKRYWFEVPGFGIFTVTDRMQAAEWLADKYLEHVQQGYAFKTKPRAKNPHGRFPFEIGDGYEVTKIGMDTNGNHSVWVRHLDKRAKKIKTLGNLPLLHRRHVMDSATVAELREYLATYGKNPASRSGVKIVHNKLLGGWYIVRGAHHTPLGGRFASKAEAEAWLRRKNPAPSIGTARAARPSQITKRKPTRRLVARRKRNVKKGYYPNPDHAKFHDLHYEVMAKTSTGKWLTISVFSKEVDAKQYARAYAKLHPRISVKVEKQ